MTSTHPRKFRQSFTRDRFFKTLDDALSRKICGGYIKNSYRYHDFFYSSSFLFIFHFSGRHTIGHLFEMICCNWCDCSLIQCSSCTVMLYHIGLHLAIYFFSTIWKLLHTNWHCGDPPYYVRIVNRCKHITMDKCNISFDNDQMSGGVGYLFLYTVPVFQCL